LVVILLKSKLAQKIAGINVKLSRPKAGTQWKMFSAEGAPRIIQRHRIQVEIATQKPVIEIVFEVATDEASATHWAWLKDELIDMVQPTYDALNMCFAYDPIGQEEAGIGLRIPLIRLPNNC
jgi:hypothetical protein